MRLFRRQFLSVTAGLASLTAASKLFAEEAPMRLAAETDIKPTAPGAPAPAVPVAYNAPTEIRKIGLINLRELEAKAQKVIPAGGFGYISSAAGDEWTKQENEAAYKRITIQPHQLTGYPNADLSTSLLGTKIKMPIITSVMGGHGLAHQTAEVGTAKGTDAAGTLFTCPSQSTKSLEEIMQASPGPKWFQIYMQEDPGVNRELLQRAKAAGYKAVVVTVDAFVSSNRETDIRNNFHSNLPRGNFPNATNGGYGTSPQKHDLGWADIEFAQKESGLPVLIKGVMSPDLAVMAIEHGLAGIQVSNHGGRQLDDQPASITVLPRIAEAVGGRIPIVIDGGVRRGQDVFKALALGANAVAVARPVMYGLGLGGWMGVQEVLEHLAAELTMTMRLAGAKSVGEISKRFLTV